MVKVGKNKAQPFTDKERNAWNEFVNERTLRLHDQQRKMICKIYARVFNLPYLEVSKDQDQRLIFKMIDKLDQVYKINIK